MAAIGGGGHGLAGNREVMIERSCVDFRIEQAFATPFCRLLLATVLRPDRQLLPLATRMQAVPNVIAYFLL
jgi:hypothetical protein